VPKHPAKLETLRHGESRGTVEFRGLHTMTFGLSRLRVLDPSILIRDVADSHF
jgi:hypothetical protein